jgi:hypothetical protein
MRRKAVFAGLAAVAAFALPLSTMADSHEAPGDLTDVWWVVPKQGMENEFTEAATAHMAFRKEQGEPRFWMAFRVVVGHNMRVVMFRHCCFDWADQDSYLAEESTAAIGADWNENVHPYVDHYHHYLEKIDWENSHWPDDESTQGPYYTATSWTWKMGAGPGPDEARKKVSQMALEAGWAEAGNNWLWLSRLGGEPTIAIVTPSADFAGMAPPEPSFFEFIAEQTGSAEDAAAMLTTFGSGLAKEDTTIWVYDPDLSTPSDD